jgi:hypothetical protein
MAVAILVGLRVQQLSDEKLPARRQLLDTHA